MWREMAASKRPRARRWTGCATALLLALFPWGNAGLGQHAASLAPGAQRITESLHDRSLPELVADGWQVAAVSQSGPAFAYHLVREGSLAICYLSLADKPLNSLCYRLGPAQ